MDSLTRLFGSAARAKLLRLFLFNPDTLFSGSDAALRAKLSAPVARRELTNLVQADILKRHTGKGGRFGANRAYKHYQALEEFLRATDTVQAKEVIAALKRAGALRLVALSGFFTAVQESKIDLLVVGDRLGEGALKAAISRLEAELGREIRYAAFTTEDFRYRLGVYDRLVRDVLDYPHRLLLDRIGL
jgi:predicted nucleotidyltransferase